jgi:HAD superfamily hydrolase (TIGR01509 family)
VSPRNDRIEFVYFDLGNVLVSFDPAVACRNLAERFAVTTDEAEAAIYTSGLEDRFERGEVSPDQFADSIRRQLRRSEAEMPTAEVLDAASDMFVPIDSMGEVVESVRANGYRVGLLSNTCHAHWDWILRQKYFVSRLCFDVTILSYRIGSAKPDEAIYQLAEQQAEVSGRRLLFLDDRPENVAAALQRDWNAAQCVGGQPAMNVLRELRVID